MNPVNKKRLKIQQAAGITRQAANKRIREGQGGASFQENKERKAAAEAILKEHQAELARLKIDELNRILISKDEVMDHGRRVAAILSAEIAAARNNWPGKLAGRDELAIRQALDADFEILLDGLISQIEKI